MDIEVDSCQQTREVIAQWDADIAMMERSESVRDVLCYAVNASTNPRALRTDAEWDLWRAARIRWMARLEQEFIGKWFESDIGRIVPSGRV